MFGGGRNCGPPFLISFPSHNPCQRVDFGCPLGLIFQQVPDLIVVLFQKLSLNVDKAARHAVSLSLASRADNHLRRLRAMSLPFFAFLLNLHPLARRKVNGCRLMLDSGSGSRGCPAAVSINVTADFADLRFIRSAWGMVTSGWFMFVINVFGPSLVCVSFVAFASSHS
jgi:hypothetical protein